MALHLISFQFSNLIIILNFRLNERRGRLRAVWLKLYNIIQRWIEMGMSDRAFIEGRCVVRY